MAAAAPACGGDGSSSNGDGEGSSGDGTGTDTGDTVENCGAAFPVVALGYESLAWPNSTPFDADVLSVEGDVAQLNASETSDFRFAGTSPSCRCWWRRARSSRSTWTATRAPFHHWFQTQNRLLIAARYRTGLGEDFTVDRVPASQLEVDIDGGTKVGSCFDELITGEPVYEVFEHAIVFSDGETELSLKAGEAGELDSAVSNRLAMLKVYQALSFQNATCDGPCEGASAYQRLIFSQRVDY